MSDSMRISVSIALAVTATVALARETAPGAASTRLWAAPSAAREEIHHVHHPESVTCSEACREGAKGKVRSASLDPDSLVSLATLRRGDGVVIPLLGGEDVTGRTDLVRTGTSGWVRVAGELTGPRTGSFSLASSGNGFSGRILLSEKDTAYVITEQPDGRVLVQEQHLSKILCFPFPRLDNEPALGAARSPVLVPPIHSSRPGATAVLYMDFDGETVTDPDWNGGATIVAQPPSLSNTQITEVWNRVKEDFWPFNVDVTTDLSRYNSAPVGSRMRCIVTPTDTARPGAGGVAYLNSFDRAGSSFSSTIPCWAFNSGVVGAAETISHEVGHTFGLSHDGRTIPGSGTEAYYEGHGSGAVGWGPIMGAVFSKSLVQWSRGEYLYANNQEDDLAIIGNAANGFGFIADEAGDTRAAAATLHAPGGSVNQAGIISGAGDVDYYAFSAGAAVTVNITASPSTVSPNLDILLELQNSAGTVLASSNPDRALNAAVNHSVPAGFYYVKVQGTGRGTVLGDGYSSYGSISHYLLTGTAGSGGVPPPVLSAEPAVTPGTQNTIYWGAVGAMPSGSPRISTAATQQATATSRTAQSSAAPGTISRGGTASAGTSLARETLRGETGRSPLSVVPWNPGTERYFDPLDRQSDGVMIISLAPSSPPAATPGVVAQSSATAESYAWWDWSGSVAIPDSDLSWDNGVNGDPPSGVPAGAYVTRVSVHHEITHTYIGDLECKVYNSTHEWMVRDNEGGSADNVNETRENATHFAGDDPVQDWYYRVRDTVSGDTGTLTAMQLYVYYDTVPRQPNLTPYQPSGWSDEIVVSKATGTRTDGSPLYPTDTLYVDWAVINNGPSATATRFHTELYVDGVLEYAWYSDPPLDSTDYVYVDDYNIGNLSAGSHTLRIKTDRDNVIAESNEGDNEYVRTITVESGAVTYYAECDDNPGFSSPLASGWIGGTHHTFTGLAPGLTYWYRVKAKWGGEDSIWSNVEHSQQAQSGSVQFKAAAYSVGEDHGSIRIYVSRTGGSSGAASVNYATANGWAVAGVDYSARSGTLNWSDGDSADKHVDVPIINDSTAENDEDFTAALSGASGASLGSPSTTTLTIEDNETTGWQGRNADIQLNGPNVVVAWATSNGWSYLCESTEDLADDPIVWSNVSAGWLVATGATMSATDTAAWSGGRRLYRIRVRP
jgi:subtilisin-like proprotein convertase family protein